MARRRSQLAAFSWAVGPSRRHRRPTVPRSAAISVPTMPFGFSCRNARRRLAFDVPSSIVVGVGGPSARKRTVAACTQCHPARSSSLTVIMAVGGCQGGLRGRARDRFVHDPVDGALADLGGQREDGGELPAQTQHLALESGDVLLLIDGEVQLRQRRSCCSNRSVISSASP